MRPLRSCDFCDADAVGVFELLPPDLEPSEDEQRRVALCADCKPRLEGLLEPLLARAGATTAGGGDDADPPADDAADGRGPLLADTTDANADPETTADESGTPADPGSTVDPGAGDADATGDVARPPTAYAKVMRLLRNRDLPMERRAVESLAEGAYDLEDHEAEAIVDHALEQGELVQNGSQLERP